MNDGPKASIRYRPISCSLLGKPVWAILTQQADRSWRIVNCLDKEESCFSIECAFTKSGGRWPFSEEAPPRADNSEDRMRPPTP